MPAHPILRTTYYADARVLEILFVTGKRHSFAAVPPEVAQAMGRSSSKGLFFTHRLRGRYEVTVTEAGSRHVRPHGDAQLI